MEVYKVIPRGFCAGVRNALNIVEQSLFQYGKPIYVRHEIVHNRHIIERLKSQGIIFIEELDEIQDISRPVIFSAHGVSETVKQQAKNMKLLSIDATCPLVNVVHQQIKKLEAENAEIIVIGKPSHPEIIGTVGQTINQDKVHIISSLQEAKSLDISKDAKIGIVTQTTLSIDDTKDIMLFLRNRFSNIVNYSKINICFATTNRQKAIQKLVELTPNIIIIGSKNSSNSTHLKEAALHYGAKQAWLIDDYTELELDKIDECESVDISAGASAPEYLVDELIDFFEHRYNNINISDVTVFKENTRFK